MQSYWSKQSSILIGTVLSILASVFLSSCGSGAKKINMRPFNPKPPEIIDENIKRPPGSLYTGYDNLFSDDKAYRVGDTITIKIVENVKGQGASQSGAAENSSLNLGFPSPTVLGKPLINKSPILGINTGSSHNYKGKGSTARSAKLIATITARVVKVYPNGNLFVVGKKVIKINDDTQILRISGIVKPTYIQQDNSVDSSRISDMYVEYNGKGFFADTEEPGWLYKFFAKIWPF